MCCQAINKYANPLVTDYDPSSGEWVISCGSLWTKRAINASLFLISITALVCTLLLAMTSKDIMIATSVTAGAFFVLGCVYTALLTYVKANRWWENVLYDQADLIAARKDDDILHEGLYRAAINRRTAAKTTADAAVAADSDSDD